MQSTRAEWAEGHDGEEYLVIAEKFAGVWSFFIRSSWELRWYPLPTTEARIQRAEFITSGDAGRVAA
jgi:hypothetical protein